MVEQLTVGNGGWCRWESSQLRVPVFVRMSDDGRLGVADLFIPGVEGLLDGDLLRQVPLGRVEAWARGEGEAIRARMGSPSPDLRCLVGYFATSFGTGAPDHWVKRSFLAQLPEPTEPRAPALPLTSALEAGEEPPGPADAVLDVPEQRPYGDDFYRQVAAAYLRLAGRTRSPAGLLADANKVPASTSHRWVKVARSRGFLPPGQPGKAG